MRPYYRPNESKIKECVEKYTPLLSKSKMNSNCVSGIRVWFEFKFYKYNFTIGGYKWFEFCLEYNPHFIEYEDSKKVHLVVLRKPWRSSK